MQSLMHDINDASYANPVSDQRSMLSERVHETKKNRSSLLNSLSNSDIISLPLNQLKEFLLALTSNVVKGLPQSP